MSVFVTSKPVIHMLQLKSAVNHLMDRPKHIDFRNILSSYFISTDKYFLNMIIEVMKIKKNLDVS